MDPPATITSDFFRSELERALEENGFALMAWDVKPDGNEPRGAVAHAEANVELLPEEEAQGDKGRTVRIQLTLRGYQITQGDPDRQHHETLDDLLAAVSPAFVRRRQKLLFSKLEGVVKARSWDVQDDNEDEEQKQAGS